MPPDGFFVSLPKKARSLNSATTNVEAKVSSELWPIRQVPINSKLFFLEYVTFESIFHLLSATLNPIKRIEKDDIHEKIPTEWIEPTRK